MSTVTADPRAAARAMLNLTARSWGVAQAAAPTVVTAPEADTARVNLTKPRLPTGGAAWTTRRAEAADVTRDQWPYWPSYPGLAAHWR